MEVKLYQLGNMLLDRYRTIFQRLYHEDRDLTVRRSVWSYILSLLSTATFYATYVWIVLEAIAGRISLGDLTMYLVVFRQGQSTFSSLLTSIGGMYEDCLYLSNLYEFLEEPVPEPSGYATYRRRAAVRERELHLSRQHSARLEAGVVSLATGAKAGDRR
jgi:ABC-type multidrug transport system fused ATPase/permease subunit